MNYKNFIWTCVSNPFDSKEELMDITESWLSISKKEFLENIDKESDENYLLIKDIKQYPNDYEFYKTPDNTIYFYVHSAIEHFFN